MRVVPTLGIPSWPSTPKRDKVGGEGGEPAGNHLLFCSGWILSLIALRKNTAVAVMMIMVSLSFTAVAVLGIIMLKKVSWDRPLGRTRAGFGPALFTWRP